MYSSISYNQVNHRYMGIINTMTEVLVSHLFLIHFLLQKNQHGDMMAFPKIFWESSLFEEITLSELII